ncbi:hypothetical protein IAT38_001695 [Cryptococcus sp. DSM 104549]
MQPEPTSQRQSPADNTFTTHQSEQDDLDNDFSDLALATPSRPGGAKRSTPGKGKKLNSGKAGWKMRDRVTGGGDGGDCSLLNLPEDLIHLLLSRLPPRTLLRLSETCKLLHQELEDESIWRKSYVNHFFGEGTARDPRCKEEVMVLAQSCLNTGGRGWKKEALSREAMTERWVQSKSSIIVHTPPNGLIHSISLSYPPFVAPAPKGLVVGKSRQASAKGKTVQVLGIGDSSHQHQENGESGAGISPKMTHRQKYEALLAASTRPPPFLLSASMVLGGVVKSDPLSGKVSKGFWGPGKDANFHIRPHLDPLAEPSAIFLPSRTQSFVLWGLRTGGTVYTNVQTRTHATHGGRASSVNVYSFHGDAHEGPISDIWAQEDRPAGEAGMGAPLRWVTAGMDGRVKLWELEPGSSITKAGKGKQPGKVEFTTGAVVCLFTSELAEVPLPDRPDEVKRRQAAAPDGILRARYDAEHDVVAAVTEDGDLRLWFAASSGEPKEVRVDLGSAHAEGEVRVMEMDVNRVGRDGEVVAAVLIHRQGSHLLLRVDITPSGQTSTTTFATPTGLALSSILPSFRPSLPIASPHRPARSNPMLARIITPGETPESTSPPAVDNELALVPLKPHGQAEFGRLVVAGDVGGFVHIWAWETEKKEERAPIRSWEAMQAKVTAVDQSCGLVAVGSCDGYIKIYDPYPTPPLLLRSFHASHLSPGELLIAASDQPDAPYYTVNKIVLENDLVVATIGRKVFAWKSGTGKGRQGGKEGNGWKKTGAGKGDGRGGSRGFVMKAIHQTAMDDHAALTQYGSPSSRPANSHEVREREAMEEMGLEDGEDALQYALMLSMEEQSGTRAPAEESVPVSEFTSSRGTPSRAWSGSSGSGSSHGIYDAGTPTNLEVEGYEGEEEEEEMDAETAEAIRQVEAFKKAEEEELARVLAMIQQAEQ